VPLRRSHDGIFAAFNRISPNLPWRLSPREGFFVTGPFAMQAFLPDELIQFAVQFACYVCAAITVVVSYLFTLRF
jgi:hypothetical protein